MTSMIEVKTAELIGPALDWAVAAALGAYSAANGSSDVWGSKIWSVPGFKDMRWDDWTPSTDWSQGGPLIEKHNVQLLPPGREWDAQTDLRQGPSFWAQAFGSTALIAACRAIVAAKLGDTVRVPAALVGGDA